MTFVITVDIVGPLPNIAKHIVESIRVGLLFITLWLVLLSRFDQATDSSELRAP